MVRRVFNVEMLKRGHVVTSLDPLFGLATKETKE